MEKQKEIDIRRKVQLSKEHIEHTSSTDYPNVYSSTSALEFSFDFARFKEVNILLIYTTRIEWMTEKDLIFYKNMYAC